MTSTISQAGTVKHIDPTTLVIEANVRASAPVTPEFVRSIKENGVLVPVLARRDEHGNVLVRAGQRRTLGAREAGVATIPVFVVDADETTATRIIQQMIENDHREALTGADRAAAFQQLAFEGLSVASIAKRTATKKGEVEKALAVAASGVAASAIQEHALTLDQAAVLIEFEEHPEARESLVRTATTDPAQFAHQAQRLRDQIERARVKAEARADLEARGFTLLDHEPWMSEWKSVEGYVTGDGEAVTVADVEKVEKKATYVQVWHNGEVNIGLYVLDPKVAGFKKAQNATASTPMSEEDKAWRRTVVKKNREWDSAETVRREWLAGFLTRKTLPKNTATVIATALTMHTHEVSAAVGRGNSLAHTLLGVEPHRNGLAGIIASTPTKAQHVALAVVLGAIEDSTGRHTWRNPNARTAAYLSTLGEWGYPLSDVERGVVDAAAERPVDAVDQEAVDGDDVDQDAEPVD